MAKAEKQAEGPLRCKLCGSGVFAEAAVLGLNGEAEPCGFQCVGCGRTNARWDGKAWVVTEAPQAVSKDHVWNEYGQCPCGIYRNEASTQADQTCPLRR